MHEMKIEVKIMGYFPGKNLPDQVYCSKISYDV